MSDARGRWLLVGMMLLIYGGQGAWYPLLSVHLADLGLRGRAIGWIFATLALASMVAPLAAGRLADRYIAAQRLMAIHSVAGCVLLMLLATGWVSSPYTLFLVFLALWAVLAPINGLGATLTLRNVARPREQFGGIRLWGTVGWMLVGWLVSLAMAARGTTSAGEGAFEAFWIGAGLYAVLAVHALWLPDTPPLERTAENHGDSPNASFRDDLLSRRPVLIYLITAFAISLTVPNMFQVIPAHLEARGLPRPWIASVMTVGQIPEILALAVLPSILRRLGFRGTMALGIGAWVLRYATLLFGPPLWVAIAGIPLHGVGIGCFSIVGQMYLDSQAPPDRRASTQGLNLVVTSGLGSFLGNLLAGETVQAIGIGNPLIFLTPLIVSGLGLAIWVLAPRGKAKRRGNRGESPDAHGPQAVAEGA